MIEKANATANKNVDRKIIKEKLGKIAAEADISLRDIFADIDRVAMKRTEDVCRALPVRACRNHLFTRQADTDTATAGARLLTLCTPMFSDVKLPSSDTILSAEHTR